MGLPEKYFMTPLAGNNRDNWQNGLINNRKWLASCNCFHKQVWRNGYDSCCYKYRNFTLVSSVPTWSSFMTSNRSVPQYFPQACKAVNRVCSKSALLWKTEELHLYPMRRMVGLAMTQQSLLLKAKEKNLVITETNRKRNRLGIWHQIAFQIKVNYLTKLNFIHFRVFKYYTWKQSAGVKNTCPSIFAHTTAEHHVF